VKRNDLFALMHSPSGDFVPVYTKGDDRTKSDSVDFCENILDRHSWDWRGGVPRTAEVFDDGMHCSWRQESGKHEYRCVTNLNVCPKEYLL